MTIFWPQENSMGFHETRLPSILLPRKWKPLDASRPFCRVLVVSSPPGNKLVSYVAGNCHTTSTAISIFSLLSPIAETRAIEILRLKSVEYAPQEIIPLFPS